MSAQPLRNRSLKRLQSFSQRDGCEFYLDPTEMRARNSRSCLVRSLSQRFVRGHIFLAQQSASDRTEVSKKLLEVLEKDFAEHGASVIEAVRIGRPHEYLKVVVSLMPKQLEIDSIPTGTLWYRVCHGVRDRPEECLR